MKLDLTKLPVAEAIIGFLIAALAVTFVLAFGAVNGGDEEQIVEPSPSASPGGSPSPGGGPEVVMRDNSFAPNELTVKSGATVTIQLKNEGSAIHNMHIAGSDGYSGGFCAPGGGDPCSDPNTVSGGQTAALAWAVPAQPGKVDFRCDFHPQEMTGTITIE